MYLDLRLAMVNVIEALAQRREFPARSVGFGGLKQCDIGLEQPVFDDQSLDRFSGRDDGLESRLCCVEGFVGCLQTVPGSPRLPRLLRPHWKALVAVPFRRACLAVSRLVFGLRQIVGFERGLECRVASLQVVAPASMFRIPLLERLFQQTPNGGVVRLQVERIAEGANGLGMAALRRQLAAGREMTVKWIFGGSGGGIGCRITDGGEWRISWWRCFRQVEPRVQSVLGGSR